MATTQNGYIIHTLPARAKKLQTLDFIKEIALLEMPTGVAEPGIFPQDANGLSWNKDNYGPLYIPKAGATIRLTPENLSIYKKAISVYEHNSQVEVKQGKLFIAGKLVTHYTFKQNYYFMMGDNRHNSNDSRYWGFVPEEYVVGKATLVWLSADSTAAFPANIRWNRILSSVN